VLPLSLVAERVGLVAAAAALGKNRKILQRWKARPGCPLASADGKVDVEELRSWAQREGLLERGRGRPTGVEQALSEAAAVAAPEVVKAARALEDAAGGFDEWEVQYWDALERDDRPALLRLSRNANPKKLKLIEAGAKARSALADAIKREQDNQVRRRELLPVGDVVAAIEQNVGAVMATLEALPGKVSPRLVDQNYDAVYALLDAEIAEMRRGMSALAASVAAG
jgi:ribosome-associated protein YbcJ (S4-like RNA binding protein)